MPGGADPNRLPYRRPVGLARAGARAHTHTRFDHRPGGRRRRTACAEISPQRAHTHISTIALAAGGGRRRPAGIQAARAASSLGSSRTFRPLGQIQTPTRSGHDGPGRGRDGWGELGGKGTGRRVPFTSPSRPAPSRPAVASHSPSRPPVTSPVTSPSRRVLGRASPPATSTSTGQPGHLRRVPPSRSSRPPSRPSRPRHVPVTSPSRPARSPPGLAASSARDPRLAAPHVPRTSPARPRTSPARPLHVPRMNPARPLPRPVTSRHVPWASARLPRPLHVPCTSPARPLHVPARPMHVPPRSAAAVTRICEGTCRFGCAPPCSLSLSGPVPFSRPFRPLLYPFSLSLSGPLPPPLPRLSG